MRSYLNVNTLMYTHPQFFRDWFGSGGLICLFMCFLYFFLLLAWQLSSELLYAAHVWARGSGMHEWNKGVGNVSNSIIETQTAGASRVVHKSFSTRWVDTCCGTTVGVRQTARLNNFKFTLYRKPTTLAIPSSYLSIRCKCILRRGMEN